MPSERQDTYGDTNMADKMKIKLYLKEKGSTDVVEFQLPYIDSLTPKGKRLFVKKLKQKFAQRGVELKKAVFV